MFTKPFKFKSNNTLKNSEKKHLAQRLHDEFPSTTEEKVKDIVPTKSSCICIKLVLHSGVTVNVYTVDNVPMIIETNEGLVPTVSALWKVPDLLPVIIIHTPVLSKMQGGAPLYLPGVSAAAGGVGFPRFSRGSLVALCTQDNAAAAAVGRAALSSGDMLLRAAGVCMETLHVFGDHLCKEAKFVMHERPRLGPAAYSAGDDLSGLSDNVGQLSIDPIKEEWPSLGKPSIPTPAPPALSQPAHNQPALIADVDHGLADADVTESELLDDTVVTESSEIEEDEIPIDMDGLLRWCLLSFIKLEGKKVELPLKTNLLYKNYLIALCPPDRTLDVKKSSYKKLGKFLEAAQQEGLLEVRELDKGVSAVLALSLAHPAVRAHAAPAQAPPPAPAPPPRDSYEPPRVRELYCVTAHVADLLAPNKKGTALTASDVRAALAQYVRVHQLATPPALRADAALAALCRVQPQDTIQWEVLMSTVLSKMTPSTEMTFSDGTVKLNKSKLEPIKMQVTTRSGNKKVTLVSNLEQFGFRLSALAQQCQAAAAAACGVTRAPGARADQLLLQGDQTHFIAKLLIEKYGLPKKFLEGADKALNKKK